MLKNPRIRIQKKIPLNDKGHFRYYSANGKGIKEPKIELAKYPQLRTEKDLLRFIYDHWGEGTYLILGNAKGVRGFWVFWKGKITKDGFIFYPKNYSRKEINQWEKEIKSAPDKRSAETFTEIRDEVKKEEILKNKKRRYGFQPFLQKSGNRGEFRFWDDDNLILKKDEDEEEAENKQWEINQTNEHEKWIDVTNKEEFENW